MKFRRKPSLMVLMLMAAGTAVGVMLSANCKKSASQTLEDAGDKLGESAQELGDSVKDALQSL